jgi:molecular chaperone DnaJ
MKGKGFPRIRRSSKGDQLVKIQVETPKKLSSNAKKIMKELSSVNGKVKNQFQKMKF